MVNIKSTNEIIFDQGFEMELDIRYSSTGSCKPH